MSNECSSTASAERGHLRGLLMSCILAWHRIVKVVNQGIVAVDTDIKVTDSPN